jgi:hypothetical protein
MHRAISASISNLDLQIAYGRVAPVQSSLRLSALLLICSVLLTGCLGTQASTPAVESSASVQDVPAANENAVGPCDDLAISIADLPQAQALFAGQRDDMESEAHAWQADAQLVSVDIGCDFSQAAECVVSGDASGATQTSQDELETCVASGEDAMRLTAVFYSPETDTSWSYPERDEIIDFAEKSLDPGEIDFAVLRDQLNRAGFTDEMLLPAGVSATAGEDTALVYSLMAYPPGDDAAVKDLLIIGADGTVTEQPAAS